MTRISTKTTLGVLLLLASSVQADDHPKYAPHVARLVRSHEYFAKHDAPDFWSLIPYYVGGDCGPASMTMVLNAMRAGQDLKASDKLFERSSIGSTVSIYLEGGDKGIKGMSLDGFGRVLAKTLKKLKLDDWSFEIVRAEPTEAFKKKVHELLVKNEESADDFVVPLFLQKVFTGDPEGAIGHYAPVAAYDGKRVLVLDPDREWYEPYWVPEDVFIAGMTDSKADSIKPGGFVHIFKKH